MRISQRLKGRGLTDTHKENIANAMERYWKNQNRQRPEEQGEQRRGSTNP